MNRALFLVAPCLIALAACGGQTPAENKADQLDAAAEQSTPVAEEILENTADEIEAGNVADPDSAAINALDHAANVQTAQDRAQRR